MLDLRKRRGQHGTAATAEHEPERADELGTESLAEMHGETPAGNGRIGDARSAAVRPPGPADGVPDMAEPFRRRG